MNMVGKIFFRVKKALTGLKSKSKRKSVTVKDYVDRKNAGMYRVVKENHMVVNPLPRNVPSRDRLNRQMATWGHSRWDIPELRAEETLVATIPDCRIAFCSDDYGNEFYYHVILTDDGEVLDLRGTNMRDKHEALLASPESEKIDKGTWILGHCYINHHHWLIDMLTKLILLKEQGLADNILLPEEHMTPLMKYTLPKLGIDLSSCVFFRRPVLDVKELTVAQVPFYSSALLGQLRKSFTNEGITPHRKVYVSRDRAKWRKLVNEEEVWKVLEERGFERVFMEELSLDDQIALMNETQVLFGLDGTNMVNLLWCLPGAQIVEVLEVKNHPNPQYYALSCALGHDYWVVDGDPVGTNRPNYHDIHADHERVKEVLDKVDEVLQGGEAE